MAVKILIGGDTLPVNSDVVAFMKGNRFSLLGNDLVRLYDRADFRILNLEGPLTDRLSPVIKAGPNLAAPKETVRGLKKINKDFYGLANNHILDQGEQGLRSTMRILAENGISFAGAGETPYQASQPFIKEIYGIKTGIYCCAEHEFTLVREDRCGANPYDPLYSFEHVRALKRRCDVLIVLYHGGKEYYPYPSPELQRIFRKFAACGADCVIAQHTHCIGCMEMFRGSLLLYGQGNFIFHYNQNRAEMNSLLVELETDGEKNKFSFVPVVRNRIGIRMARGADRQRILDGFLGRSDEIKRPETVEIKYRQLAESERSGYYFGFAGKVAKQLPVRILNKLTGHAFLKWMYRGFSMLSLENYIACEAHREIVLKILELDREQMAVKKAGRKKCRTEDNKK